MPPIGRPHRFLPTEPRLRALELVRRSEASPLAPLTGLPPELDEIVRTSERRRALVYAEMDDAIDRCDRLAMEIDAGVVVDVSGSCDSDDSLTHSLDGLGQIVPFRTH